MIKPAYVTIHHVTLDASAIPMRICNIIALECVCLLSFIYNQALVALPRSILHLSRESPELDELRPSSTRPIPFQWILLQT